MVIPLVSKLNLKIASEALSRRISPVPQSYFDLQKSVTFRRTVRHAYRHSAFYKRKFDEFGIRPNKVKTPQDLGDFYTFPGDIIEHAEEFLCEKPHIVFESSGTTGRNKRVYFTQEELDNIGKYNAIGLYGWGLNQDDRIVNGFDFNIWIPGMVMQKGVEKAKILGMAAGKVDPIEVYKRIPVYRFNVVMGEPTWLIKLTELAEKHGSYPLKLILGGAEAMPEAARPWMEKVWQGAKVRMAYGTVESGGAIAFELDSICQEYHINESSFYVEIFNPDENGYGEVVYTTLDRSCMPLIRYRNRDISKLMEEKCVCGFPYRKLAKLRGRADEMVIASGGNLYPLLFEDVLKDIPQISCDWQIVFRLEGIKEVMEFHLEPKGPEDSQEIQTKIFSNIQSRYPDLWKNYSIGIFKIDFLYHPVGSLRANRKLVRIVDKRF